jgi:hypothetical protein
MWWRRLGEGSSYGGLAAFHGAAVPPAQRQPRNPPRHAELSRRSYQTKGSSRPGPFWIGAALSHGAAIAFDPCRKLRVHRGSRAAASADSRREVEIKARTSQLAYMLDGRLAQSPAHMAPHGGRLSWSKPDVDAEH